MIEIADDSSGDLTEDEDGNTVVKYEAIQRDRLRVDTRKWILARMAPKRYGDKVQHDHKGGLSVSIHMDTKPEEE